MFLRRTIRKKDGKEHHYWSLVENKRVSGGRVVQRHVLYLGEINSSQQEAWRKSIEVFEDGAARPRTLAKGCWAIRSCGCGCVSLSCAGRGNGARAGWR